MEIDEIIRMLDEKTTAGVSRIKVLMDEEQATETVKEAYHHGRCDVGSPWADAKMGNCD